MRPVVCSKMSSSSNTQAVILVSVIFLVAIGTILYVNFGAVPPDHSESALTGSKRSSSTTDDSINYEGLNYLKM